MPELMENQKLIGAFIIVLTSFYFLRKYFRGGQFTKDSRIDGKVVIITGANTGLGFESAVDLAQRGGKVYIACRDRKRAVEALEKIKERSGSKIVYFLQLNLASLKSIREFVEKFKSIESRLDVLINNAGIIKNPQGLTEDGFELHMGVNHLGHFYLTHLLLDLLQKSAPSRIINVSSMGHAWAKLDREDFFCEKSYDYNIVYCNTKLANNLFTRELSKRLSGTGVDVNCCHPGVVATEIFRFQSKPKDGAQTQIRLAVDPDLQGVTGKYFADCVEKKPSKESLDDELASWLWDKSVELVGL